MNEMYLINDFSRVSPSFGRASPSFGSNPPTGSDRARGSLQRLLLLTCLSHLIYDIVDKDMLIMIHCVD